MEDNRPYALIVEDANDLAIIFARALESANYKTEVVLDGYHAIKRLEERAPALLILDMHLPGKSGPQVLEFMREDQEGRYDNTRIVIATADAARTLGAPEEQADVILVKPISFVQLRDIAQRLHPGD